MSTALSDVSRLRASTLGGDGLGRELDQTGAFFDGITQSTPNCRLPIHIVFVASSSVFPFAMVITLTPQIDICDPVSV